MADPDKIALALGRIPSGLFIVTAAEPGQPGTGYLASFVQQASLEPPLVLISVGPTRAAHAALSKATHFGIHVVEKDQKQWLKHFGRGFEPEQDAFAGLSVDRSRQGVPHIQGISTFLIAEKKQILQPGGDHDLFVGHVIEADFPDSIEPIPEPWIHLRKNGRSY